MTVPGGGGDGHGDTEPYRTGDTSPRTAAQRPGTVPEVGRYDDREPYDQAEDDDRSGYDRYDTGATDSPDEPPDDDARPTAIPTGSRQVGVRRHTNAPAIRAAIALLVAVLVLGGLALWGYRQLTGKSTAAPSPCPSGQSLQPATALTPASVRLRVTNGTSRSGLAGRTGDALRARRFVVLGVGNATKPVRGPAVIRYGAGAEPQAKLLALQLPAVRLQAVAGSPGTLELVLGSSFRRLRTPAQVTAATRKPGTRAAVASPTATCR